MSTEKEKIFEVKVYDEAGEITKTCTATEYRLKFGAVRSLMGLLEIESINDTAQLIKMINNAWESLTVILTEIFPDMEEEDWDHVYIDELVPVVLSILKGSFGKILTIPNDSKN